MNKIFIYDFFMMTCSAVIFASFPKYPEIKGMQIMMKTFYIFLGI